ncbi:carbohydrate ABC transporter permease [Moorellaceae bacterium AZ2]
MRYRQWMIIGTYGFLTFLLTIAIFPFFWMISTSLKDSASVITYPPSLWPRLVYWRSYWEVLTTAGFANYFLNSLKVAALTTIITIVLATCAGLGFARFKLPFGRQLQTLVLVSQLFPLVLLVTPYYTIMKKLGILNTHLCLILAYISFVLPFSIWMLANYFKEIPEEIVEAAMVDGCTRLTALTRIVLPLSAPGIVATTINAFILAWNEFLFAQTFIDSPALRTLPIGLRSFIGQYNTQWNLLMAGAVISTVPVVILFVLLQRYLIAGLTAGSVKG